MIQTDLSKIKYYAQKSEKQNWLFRSYLKSIDNDESEIDTTVHRLNIEITNQIDCKTCANCCKEKSPLLSEKEVLLISNRIGILKEEFGNKYLEINDEDNNFMISTRPCPLNKNKSMRNI